VQGGGESKEWSAEAKGSDGVREHEQNGSAGNEKSKSDNDEERDDVNENDGI
jgi:hypothetical protein